MIENEQQYNLISEELAKYEEALTALFVRQKAELPYLRRWKSLENSLGSIVSELGGQLMEYEALRDGRMKKLELASLAELGDATIRVSLSPRLTDGHISERKQWYEKPVKGDERGENASARLRQVQELLDKLGIELYIEEDVA